MKSYIDNIFNTEILISVNKNSRDFDLTLLEELKQLKNIPTNKFDTYVRKIMRKKSSCKLWIDKSNRECWDGSERKSKKTNYRCCPTSQKANYYFCLILNESTDGITVADGFLSAV